jgi:hypothetical protein
MEQASMTSIHGWQVAVPSVAAHNGTHTAQHTDLKLSGNELS